jgi:hypothetical protein
MKVLNSTGQADLFLSFFVPFIESLLSDISTSVYFFTLVRNPNAILYAAQCTTRLYEPHINGIHGFF